MQTQTTYFGGLVTQTFETNPDGRWREEWSGPGGTFIVRRLMPSRTFDATTTFVNPAGDKVDCGPVLEGEDYPPEFARVFGDELWPVYLAGRGKDH